MSIDPSSDKDSARALCANATEHDVSIAFMPVDRVLEVRRSGGTSLGLSIASNTPRVSISTHSPRSCPSQYTLEFGDRDGAEFLCRLSATVALLQH